MSQKDAFALLQHVMAQKLTRQGRFIDEAIKSVAGLRPEGKPAVGEDGKIRMTETRIYVGLNDGETRRQEFETGHYLGILKEICRSCHVAFSVDVEEGGYYHEDGEYTEETSLVLVLIEADPDVVQKIANELCARFHQESVLVTVNQIDGRFISGGA